MQSILRTVKQCNNFFLLIHIILHRITTAVWPPYQIHAEDGCSSKDCYKGIFPDIFYAIQSKLNFTYTIEINNAAGTILENGTWTGQIGLSYIRLWSSSIFRILQIIFLVKPMYFLF